MFYNHESIDKNLPERKRNFYSLKYDEKVAQHNKSNKLAKL